MDVVSAHLNGGFARAADLTAAELLTEISDARTLVEAEADAIAHMNADHAEACRLYATKLLGAPDGDWRCVGIDPEGLELQRGSTALRLFFPQRVTAPGPLRAVLKQLAEQARGLFSPRGGGAPPLRPRATFFLLPPAAVPPPPGTLPRPPGRVAKRPSGRRGRGHPRVEGGTPQLWGGGAGPPRPRPPPRGGVLFWGGASRTS